jgi:hypothetical protein
MLWCIAQYRVPIIIALHKPGAASFMKKCESNAAASCDKAAADKNLSGAGKTSFTTKCVTDAAGN